MSKAVYPPPPPLLWCQVTENKWQLSARACCTTLMASVAGGWVALGQSYLMHDRKQEVRLVLGSSV